MFKYEGLYVDAYNKGFYLENEEKSTLKNEPLRIVEVDHGIILPAKADTCIPWGAGGVQRPDFSFVEESKTPRIFGGNYEYDHSTIEKIDDTVVYMGPFLCHWGHFICDQVSRLWYILHDIENCKIAYCGWNWGFPQTALWGNFLEFMHLLGLKDEQLIDIQKPTQFSKVIIPDLSFRRGDFYCKEYLEIFHKICSSVHKEDFEYVEKVYFTRTQFVEAQKKERGELELEEFYKENGYQVFVPEQLSLRQQVYYYQYAQNIAAIAGSITHSILFARDGLKVTILNKMNLTNGYQMIIDGMVNTDITYVDVYLINREVCFGLGPFLVGINDNLRRYAKDRNMVLPAPSLQRIIYSLKNKLWYLQLYYLFSILVFTMFFPLV